MAKYIIRITVFLKVVRRGGEKLCISNAQDTTINKMYGRKWYWDKNFTDWPGGLNITFSNYSNKPTVMWGISYMDYLMSTLHKKMWGREKESPKRNIKLTYTLCCIIYHYIEYECTLPVLHLKYISKHVIAFYL